MQSVHSLPAIATSCLACLALSVVAQEPKTEPKRTLEQAFRAWHKGFASDKKEAREETLRSMLPTKKEIEYLFPKHAATLWPLMHMDHEMRLKNVDKVAEEFTRGGAIKKVEEIDVRKDKKLSNGNYKRLLELMPADVGVFESHIQRADNSGGTIAAFIYLKGRWCFIMDLDTFPDALDNLK